MPHLNIPILIKILNQHQSILYDIYTDCNNITIAERILDQQQYIVWVIEQLKQLATLELAQATPSSSYM